MEEMNWKLNEKARLDGYYVKHMSPVMDIRCILGTIRSVLKSEGVVEGGTGAMQCRNCNDRKKKLSDRNKPFVYAVPISEKN